MPRIVVSVLRREGDGVGRGAEVAGHEGEVAGLDGDVGAGADGDAEVGLGEGGRVVDAVADDRDFVAFGLELAHDVDLLARKHLGDDAVDADGLRNCLRGGLAVAGDHHGL